MVRRPAALRAAYVLWLYYAIRMRDWGIWGELFHARAGLGLDKRRALERWSVGTLAR